MKKHWPLTMGAGISLLLLVIFFSGFFVQFGIGRLTIKTQGSKSFQDLRTLEIGEGRVGFYDCRFDLTSPSARWDRPPQSRPRVDVRPARTRWFDPRTFLWEFRLFRMTDPIQNTTRITRLGFMPAWLFMLPCAVLPVLWWRRWQREKLADRSGCCEVCGYDLRATPERCPECGTIVPSATSKARG